MGDVVEFPYGEIRNPIDDDNRDPVLDHTQEIIYSTVAHMAELGYDVSNEKMQKDMGVITNLMVGVLMRDFNRQHFMHEVLDELYNELEMVREILDDID